MTASRLKLAALLVLGPLVLLLALAIGFWTWSGQNASLATTLTQLARLLPADQTLETRDVSGSVRAGGSIGWLRWQQGALSIEARDVQLGWSLANLLQQELRLSKLSIGQLRIEDKRPATPDAPPIPPSQWSLPIKVDAAVSLNEVEWVGTSSQTFDKLAFHYVFDSNLHRIDAGYIHISSGIYEFSGDLQAQAPMAIKLQAKGVVQTQLPNSPQHLKVNAQAQITGILAGTEARLALQANLTPELAASAGAAAGSQAAMQASLSAELAPWQAQKVVRAQGQWQALDLAALWPQAPQTLLSGDAMVSPKGEGWQAHVQLTNRLSGPWNLQRLPLQTLTADLGFASGQWALQTLQATGAGGFVQASGQLNSGLWQGQAKLQGIQPADIDSRLAGSPMSGTVHAQQTAQGLGFEAILQASPGKLPAQAPAQHPSTLQTLRLQSLTAKGVWAAPILTLEAFRVDAQDAQAQGQIAYNTLNLATQGQLALSLPGLQTAMNGRLASTDGKGTLAVQVTDAALATRWLARWPAMATALNGGSVRGIAELHAQWAGGWQNEARALRVEASLRAPRLDWVKATSNQLNSQPDWQVRDLQAELSGTPGALSLKTRGLAEAGAQKLDWQAQALGGRVKAGSWQASIHQFKLTLQNGTQSVPWSLRWGAESDSGAATAQPVTLDWQQTDLQNTLAFSAGTARLQGPAAGTTTVSWQPGRWSQQPAKGTTQWQSQGRITNLPLAWVDAIGGKTMAELGISSDLMLSGDWDAAQTDILRLRATLERSAGDLRLHADDSRQRVLPAGIQEAWMQVNLDGNLLSSSLRWDSERAGKALLAFSTQLQPKASGWGWASDAPLGGSLQMKLPPVDAWSVLAPPGWRLRGTMDANVTLAGTLALPQWSGDLQARDLAVRSVVDGVDFSQGTLNARLHGQQLDIQNFTLQGAGGTSGAGGQLAMTGSVFWLPSNTTNSLASRLSMALEAQAKALRLSSRPDRRVVVSGKLAAQLNDARLTLRGALVADQALVTLPDDTTPQLSDDVVVRRPATPATAPSKANIQRPSGNAMATSTTTRVIPDVQIELDLGPDFQVRGRGLETRLAGKLTLVAAGPATPSLSGTVRTVRGTYLAYGQRLEIEQGVLRFTGPLDNPALDILAIRPKLTQRVGVQISGTALSPIIRLYAEPDLPDAEKLAWLVLGRSASGGGAETALMQQAALALLGGNGKNLSASLTQALGIDELSFRGNTSASDSTASGASVTLGKRLSSDFYLAYESSLNGAMGVFYIFYDLSRRLTLRAQAGEQSAIDLIFTLRYD